jgi:GGDEF domain-containing protein
VRLSSEASTDRTGPPTLQIEGTFRVRGFVETFETERGDVLLSVQLMLIREDQHRGGSAAIRRDRIEVPAVFRHVRSMDSREEPGAGVGRVRAPALPQAPILVDAATGARTLVGLRRDLGLDGSVPSTWGARFALLSLGIVPLPAIRSALGDGAAERVLQALVEVAPFALDPEARVYRSGADELALLLAKADASAAEQARQSLNAAVERILAVRHLPSIQAVLRPMAVPSADEAEASTAAVPLVAAV